MSVAVRPDVETAVIRYLNFKDGIRASGKVDRIGKTPCVVVRATGGEVLDPRRSVHQISVSCWGVSPQNDYEAFQLSRFCSCWNNFPSMDSWVITPATTARWLWHLIQILTPIPVLPGILLLFGCMWPVLPFRRRNNGSQ